MNNSKTNTKSDIDIVNEMLMTMNRWTDNSEGEENSNKEVDNTITYKEKMISYDIVKLHEQIKKYVQDNGVQMLNKKKAYQEASDFDDLIYKYTPKSYIDVYDNETNQKGYVDEDGWEQV